MNGEAIRKATAERHTRWSSRLPQLHKKPGAQSIIFTQRTSRAADAPADVFELVAYRLLQHCSALIGSGVNLVQGQSLSTSALLTSLVLYPENGTIIFYQPQSIRFGSQPPLSMPS